MTTEVLLTDYLGRLEAAAGALPTYRRAELAREVREHIDAALAEAGNSDDVTVLNILERLGSPEEIVASEAGTMRSPDGAGRASALGASSASSRLGAVEVTALLLLGLAWPALLLPPFGFLSIVITGMVLWLSMGVIGLVLVWASGAWTTRRKLITTVIVVALYAAVFVVTTPTSVVFTPAGSPIETTTE